MRTTKCLVSLCPWTLAISFFMASPAPVSPPPTLYSSCSSDFSHSSESTSHFFYRSSYSPLATFTLLTTILHKLFSKVLHYLSIHRTFLAKSARILNFVTWLVLHADDRSILWGGLLPWLLQIHRCNYTLLSIEIVYSLYVGLSHRCLL